MRRLTKAAMVIVSAAAAAETFGQVMGFTRFDCGDEITYEYSSVADACASYDVNAYRAPNAGIYECTVCASDPVGPGPGIIPGPRIIIVTPPACPAGQHYNDDGECQDDHVCGDDEIGGGSEECEQCGEGTEPNEDGTACVAASGEEYRVARCARDLDTDYGEYLPAKHPNILTEKVVDDVVVESTQRGFFPAEGFEAQAAINAAVYAAEQVLRWTPPFPTPSPPVYVPSGVREDPNQGICGYERSGIRLGLSSTPESVSKARFDLVNDRILKTVHTAPPKWHIYHAIVNNSIDWGNEVLR